MKIFIGWSGDLSRQIAELLHDWLQSVIQTLNPFLSLKDIERGSSWHNELTKSLKDCKFGIFCITEENQNNNWMHFEAGTLIKEIGKSQVIPFLFDINKTEIKGPFSHFQGVTVEREGLFGLVNNLNNNLDGELALSESKLLESFNTYWPRFQEKLNELEAYSTFERTTAKQLSEPFDIKEIENILNRVISINRLHDYGIVNVFDQRTDSLIKMKNEIETEGKEVVIIGSSLMGIIGIGGDAIGNRNLVRIAIEDALKKGIKVKILMTNPIVAHHRSKQEHREKGEIEREIIENLIYFLKIKKLNKEINKNLFIKLYSGTPTFFMLCSSHIMMFNPYTYFKNAFESYCFQVTNRSPIYKTYYESHYAQAWPTSSLTRPLPNDLSKAVDYLKELINGNNQHGEPIFNNEAVKNNLKEKLTLLIS